MLRYMNSLLRIVDINGDLDLAKPVAGRSQIPRARRAERKPSTTAADRESRSQSSTRTLVDASLDAAVHAQPEALAGDRIAIPELYYRCQNQSAYPSAPPLARRFLLRTLSALLNEQTEPALRADPASILSLGETFDEGALDAFLKKGYRATTDRFESYLERRKAGGAREMFCDRADAERWTKQSAVVKYVDGSWLQSCHQSTSGLEARNASEPYSADAARRASRVSWQVLSEELGDGDIEKEHCAVYERLMDALAGEPTPRADDDDFEAWNVALGDGVDLPNKQCWVAAMLQLGMAISPNEFLPEILGFNLSYEGLPYHLMVTAHELRELKIDPYYFVLHISIDNAHSGHSAMARIAVARFLANAERTHGPAASAALWRRVQAGYILADTVRTTPQTFAELAAGATAEPDAWAAGVPLASDDFTHASAQDRAALEARLLAVFRGKAHAAQGLHCTAPARIGGRRIGEWLTPAGLDGAQGEEFMRALAASRAWVRPGRDGHKSRLIRECEWGGKMFGAFTTSEIETMKDWVSSLPAEDDTADDKNALPSAAALDLASVEPYLRFLSRSEEPMTAAAARTAYFTRAIQPLDFSGALRSVSSFAAWTRAAPVLYAAALAHPHGVRGAFALDANAFVRGLLPSADAAAAPVRGDVVEALIAAHAGATVPAARVRALMPSLLVSAAPLEWLPAAGPAKLAGALGMAAVKVQRNLLGFASGEDADQAGCAGTDDVLVAQDGVWELGVKLMGGGEDVTLETVADCDGEALALPALILLLNSQPTLHLPLLLGIQLALNVLLHARLAACAATPSPAWRERLAAIAYGSRYWIAQAIALGSTDATRRGWEGDGDWNELVVLGFGVAKRALQV